MISPYVPGSHPRVKYNVVCFFVAEGESGGGRGGFAGVSGGGRSRHEDLFSGQTIPVCSSST